MAIPVIFCFLKRKEKESKRVRALEIEQINNKLLEIKRAAVVLQKKNGENELTLYTLLSIDKHDSVV